jgi:hypothetical protein
MSLLGKLFGEKEPHLPLDASSPAAARLERDRATLEAFVAKVHDKLELVPGDRATYVFIGKPPDAFGIAWLESGEEHNLKRLIKEKGLPAQEVQLRSEELREAYQRSQGEGRYTTTIAGKHVLVTPSPSLERELVEIIHRVEE